MGSASVSAASTALNAAVSSLGTTLGKMGRTDKVNQWTKGNAGAVVPLTYASPVAIDLSLANNFTLTLTGNTTLANPTNIVPGQSGVITVKQDATGGRTLAFGTYYKFTGGTAVSLTGTPSASDELCYYVKSATEITISSVINDK